MSTNNEKDIEIIIINISRTSRIFLYKFSGVWAIEFFFKPKMPKYGENIGPLFKFKKIIKLRHFFRNDLKEFLGES